MGPIKSQTDIIIAAVLSFKQKNARWDSILDVRRVEHIEQFRVFFPPVYQFHSGEVMRAQLFVQKNTLWIYEYSPDYDFSDVLRRKLALTSNNT